MYFIASVRRLFLSFLKKSFSIFLNALYALGQKCIAMSEYASQKLTSLRGTVFKSGIPAKLIQMKIDERQQRFAKFYAKLNVRFDQYKQLMFDYDALCFIPDRNERIMNRLNVVRKNLYDEYRVLLQKCRENCRKRLKTD